MKLETTYKKSPSINLIPILDAIFLLMFVFMMALVQRVQKAELKLTLPSSISGATTTADQTPITISIDTSGVIYIENKKVSKVELEKELTLIKLSGPLPVIVLRGDKHANFGVVIDILDLVKKNGFKNVTIETSLKKSPSSNDVKP